MSRRNSGFTVLELLIAIVFLVVAGTIFFLQKRDLEVAARDSLRKTDINSIYYNLEEVFYPTNKAYPEHLVIDQLKGIDPEALKDPYGKTIGQEGSNYRYEPKDCVNGLCKTYNLTADLEYEADVVKGNRTH